MLALGRLAASLAPLATMATLASCTAAGDSASSAAASPTPAATASDGPVTEYADANNWMLEPATASRPVDVFHI
jgi:hypothetical protein